MIQIREALESDTHIIKEMDRDVVVFVASLDSAKDLIEVQKRHNEVFDRWYSLKDQRVFLAFDEQRPLVPVGFIWIVNNTEQFTGISYCFVMDLSIVKEYRRKGIGKMLINKAIEYTKGLGFNRIKLMVNSKNKNALRFYRQIGFDVEDLYMTKKI